MTTRSQTCLIFMLVLTFCMVNEANAELSQKWQIYKEWPFNAAEAKRRQEETAKALGIPVEKRIDLGDAVTMELVLIPAGRFIMGTPKPVDPDWVALNDDIIKAQIILFVAATTVLALVRYVLLRAWRLKRRLQMSFRFFLVLILVLSVCSWAGVGWYKGDAAKRLAEVQYLTAKVRFRDAAADEQPAHSVTLSKPFYIGKYEVTQEQYQLLMGANPSDVKGRTHPVDSVVWKDSKSFCMKIMEGARLPTEAEWEYACRAGTSSRFNLGDAESDLNAAGWYFGNSRGTRHAVGQKTGNAWGVYDMHGNVWEWCGQDYELYPSGPVTDPQGTSSGTHRVLRGGTSSSKFGECRSAYREYDLPSGSLRSGFRLLVSAIK